MIGKIMKKCLLAACGLLLLSAVRSANAWNGTGHEIIALIAWQDLTPKTQENIARVLLAHPDYADMLTNSDTPAADKPREAFLTAATWPDLVRTPGRPSYRYNHQFGIMSTCHSPSAWTRPKCPT